MNAVPNKRPIQKARGSSAEGSTEARGSTEIANNEDDDILSGIVDDTLEEEANDGDATIEMGDESDGNLVSVTKAKMALLQDSLIRTEHTVTSCFIRAAALGTKLKFEHGAPRRGCKHPEKVRSEVRQIN